MSGYDENYDDDYGQNGGAPADLRKALEKANKQLAELAKAREADAARIAEFEAKAKSQSLASLLEGKGVKPGLSRWLEKDNVEPTEDAVSKWLEENGEFFNVAPKAPAEGETQETPATPPTNPLEGLPPEIAAALQGMQNAQALDGLSDNGIAGDQETAVFASIGQNAKSEADITAALTKLGIPVKSGY